MSNFNPAYHKALGAAEATIAYVKDVISLPVRGEETMRDRRERMLAAIEHGQASIARYLEEKP